MDRFRSGRLAGLVTFFMAIALCVPNSGCVSALATGMWLLNGNNVKAEFKDLKGKRVAVVCRPPASLGFSHANTAPDLAKQIGLLLKEHVSKIDVVSQQDVANWNDENTWDDFAEIGQALKANVGGALLATIALILGPWALGSAVVGGWLFLRGDEMVLIVLAVGVTAVTLLDWSARIWLGME